MAFGKGMMKKCFVILFGLVQVQLVFTQYEYYYSQYPYNNYYWNNNGIGDGGGGGGRNQFQSNSAVVYYDSRRILTEGDYCINSRLGVEGVCRLASKCPEVYEDFRNGIQPVVCSYSYNDVIVCCPKKENVQGNLINGLRISDQKCTDYAKFAVSTGAFTELSIMTSVHQVDIPKCDYSTGLIVGGELAKHGEFPHMAAIGWTEQDGTVSWNCGGTLISEYYVLTAGHCSSNFGTKPDIVRLGAQNLAIRDNQNPPQDIRIRKVTAHPNYRHSSHYNDLALIELANRAVFSRFVRPACLWQTDYVNASAVIATGWGQIEYAGRKSDDLLKVALDVVDNNKCNTLYERSKRLKDGIIDSQICAGHLQGGKDTCQGDSGGPIQITTTHQSCVFHVIGITSFGKACAAFNTVGVYTRISSFLDWIESIVWPNIP